MSGSIANGPAVLAGRWGQVGAGERAGAGVVALGCGSVVALAAWLDPSGAGHGTHEQLGLPACTLAMAIDRPCPTCGMTTAFAHAANGDIVAALVTQPMGAFLALVTSVVFWGAIHVSVTGSRLGQAGGRMLTSRWMWGVLGLFLGSWAYKMLTW